MPGVAVHTLLAHRVLDHWSKKQSAPFDPSSPANRNAFLNGCMGPDMGLFPGGCPLVTDMVHYLKTADLPRAMMNLAKSDLELAFAWGWASHVLADIIIHPIVNQGVGDLLKGDPQTKIAYNLDPQAHARVEMGVDGFFCYHRPLAEPRKFNPIFDASSIEFLSAAFDETYGEVVTADELLNSHRACAKHSRTVMRANWVNGARHHRKRLESRHWAFYFFVFVPVRTLLGLLRPKSPLYGILTTADPPQWLIEAFDRAIDQFPAQFFDLVENKMANLQNANLDTGETTSNYDLADATLVEVQKRLKDGPV